MASECQDCYYWRGTHRDTYAPCDKRGGDHKYNESACGSFAKR